MQDFGLLLLNKDITAGGNVMLNVTVCGLVIVFMVLIVLVAVISIFGAVMSKSKKSPKKENTPDNGTVNYDNEDEQTIAVITAAVYSYYDNNKSIKPVIRSIKPSNKNSGRGVWQQAGMRQNMQPF